MNATVAPVPDDESGVRRPSSPNAAFSLFDGDWLHRVYARLHVSNHVRFRILKRCALMVVLTWVPVALLAMRGGLVGGGLTPTNFFADFAAYAQFLIALPLFMAAEPIVDSSTRGAARQLISCGIVTPADSAQLYRIHTLITRLRRSCWSDIVCIVLAYALSLAILVPEFGAHPTTTWHVQDDGHLRTLSAAGCWEFLIALPLLNYTWLRFIWKILLWIFYLERVTRMRLDLHPTHPDLTGGIGFISEAQSRFAIFILAYGISNIAATVGYEIVILKYDLWTMPVWGPLLGFTIGAPLLFTLPLFMFTRQLYRSKRRALAVYRERVTEHSRQVEGRWLLSTRVVQSAPEEIRELAELATLGTLFSRIEHMRVVPFDLRSFGQLIGSSLGSVATLLPLLHVNGDFTRIFEAIGKLLGHLGGGS
ncbi:MAG TPA: hypothetical protein VF315_04820 [Steroidobacteraceae bacterium]